jgi:FkbM family methyltransferase
MIFIDLGANMFQGLEEFTSKLNLNKETIVYSFEPNSMVYSLSKNKYIDIQNNYKNLYHFNKAVTDFTGEILFNSHHGVWDNGRYISEYTGGSNCIELNPKVDNNNGVIFDIRQEYVKCVDINELLSDIVISNDVEIYNKTIIIKCDIEGSEFKVLPKLLKSPYLKYIKEIHIEWHERFYENTSEYDQICRLKQFILKEFNDNNISCYEHH